MEKIGVTSGGAHWDVEGYRLFASAIQGVVLYVPNMLRLAREGGRYRAGLTCTQSWNGNGYEVRGGSALLGLFGDESVENDASALADQWRRVLLNTGYKESPSPRFLPLPLREVRLTSTADAAQARATEEPASSQNSRTLVLDLTAAGVQAWERAIREKSPVTGGVRLSYLYPQLMPQATARVTLHGPQVHAQLVATLSKAVDGTLYGRSDEIRAAWSALVRGGAIEISLFDTPPLDPAVPRAEILDRISEQAREQLFDTLFEPWPCSASGTGSLYALRWKSASDATNAGLTVTVEGWTWLRASLEAELSALLGALDESYIQITYESVSVPVSLVVDPSPSVSSVALSIDFTEGHPPQAPVFGSAGGIRQFPISTQRPERVGVSYRVMGVFRNNWPVIEDTGTATLMPDGNRIMVRPETWVHRHTVYMYVRRGDRIISSSDADPTDYLALTATYQASYLGAPIRAASRITPQTPIEFSYPVPPGQTVGKATLGAVGMVGGKLVRASDLAIEETEDAIYLLVDGTRVQIVGRNVVISEVDALIGRLRSANARPVISCSVGPLPEDTRELDTEVEVALIPQPTDVSCWAAALAMVVSTRDQASTTPEAVATQAGMDLETGYGWTDIRRSVTAWGLVEEGPRSAMPEEWARLLSDWGPIWVVEIGAPYHAVILGGVHGDGTPEGSYVTVYNPWPPGLGAIESKPFYDFAEEFGLGAGSEAAMVHAG